MSTNSAVTSTPVSTVPEWDELPCVRYGFPDDEGPVQSPKLRTIFGPIPDGANTASPVVVLTQDQYQRQQRLESRYAVKNARSIAKELQDEAAANDKILYPIYVESDEYHQKEVATLIGWLRKFVEDHLDVPFVTCTLYFSGRRSIHVHVPRFVSGETQRERLKEEAETFCAETDAKLDCGIYDTKGQFRLPGVEHEQTSLTKVEIDPEWDKPRIFREASDTTPNPPATYAEVLQQVFVSPETLTPTAGVPPLDDPTALFRALDSETTLLEFASSEPAIPISLIEQKQCPDDPSDIRRWVQYNAKEFSPYALAAGNPRSVAALQVKGGAFAREEKRDGATMIPAWFYGAIGGNGEFTKEWEHAPLQLSTQDYRKWDYQPGDTVVIIGGKSGNSKILDVEDRQARVVGHELEGDTGNRNAALDYLSMEGYDVGNAGSTGSSISTSTSTSSADASPGEATKIWPARDNPQSEAEALQRKAEQDGIETLTHDERIRVASRHLRYGWQPTWDWFQEQFGSQFKPQVTWTQLNSIVSAYEEYDHVDVPAKPS